MAKNKDEIKFEFSWEYVIENRDINNIVKCPFGFLNNRDIDILNKNDIIIEEIPSDYRGTIYKCLLPSH